MTLHRLDTAHMYQGIHEGAMYSVSQLPIASSASRSVSLGFTVSFNMSFGFGVGDFLAVAEASKKIWDRFEKSPSYIKDARDE